MTPKKFRDETLGKSYDVDKFPPKNRFQCYDYFAYGLYVLNIPVQSYCAITGYVCDLWRLKDQYKYYDYFEYITDPKNLKNGDWCFWDAGSSHPLGHVCMYYDGKEVGQNQGNPGKPYVTEEYTTFDIMGALRPKVWKKPATGYAEHFSKDFAHTYACGYPLNLRAGGSTSYESLCVMNKNERIQCYGYYHIDERGRTWLYVTYKNLVGFACMDYVYKVC